jgi:NADPH:quinone reductase-like Zn-dependent oxidoreductase
MWWRSAVYAMLGYGRDGADAEYAIALAGELSPKPRMLDEVQAAAVPLSALTAWQALFTHAQLSKGQRVLIHGASGGVGTYAVQLAHWAGAAVFATASAQNARLPTRSWSRRCHRLCDHTIRGRGA